MTSRGCGVLGLTAIIVNILQLSDSDAASLDKISGRQQASQLHQLPRYFRQCPTVACPPVSEDCQTVEFLVYAFQYRLPSTDDGGQPATVSVRCESCGYCLDRMTSDHGSRSASRSRSSRERRIGSGSRRRRSAVVKATLGAQCRPVESCPNVSAQCRDVRLTRVLMAGVTCRVSCPACYDAVPIRSRICPAADTSSLQPRQ